MLNYEYPPLGGGASNATYYLLKEFSLRDDIEVDLITSSSNQEYELDRMGNNITIHKLPINKKKIHFWTQKEILIYSWKAYRYMKNLHMENYDLIHAFFGVPCGAIAYIFRKDLPFIVSLRGSDVPGFNKRFSSQYVFLKPIIRMIWMGASKVIANSQGLKDMALKTDSKIDINIIYNGVDIDEFSSRDVIKDNFVVLTVARLIKRKGIEDIIRAVPEIIKADKNVLVKIIGKGDIEGDLRTLAKELKVDDLIEFLGYVPHDQISCYYSSSDVFVLPSRNEGMSNTILEAMASGLPIITTNTGGVQELIDGNGIIVPVGDSCAISLAILRLMKDRSLAEKMGRRSKDIAGQMSWSASAQSYIMMYKAAQRSPTYRRTDHE